MEPPGQFSAAAVRPDSTANKSGYSDNGEGRSKSEQLRGGVHTDD